MFHFAVDTRFSHEIDYMPVISDIARVIFDIDTFNSTLQFQTSLYFNRYMKGD